MSVPKKNTKKSSKPKRKRKKRDLKKDKKDLYSFMRRLYYLLEHHSDRIDFKKLRGGTYALYEPDTGDIIIDYRKDIISSLVHESLHHFHPNWPETKVYKEESRIMNMLTVRQIKNIIKALGRCF